MSNARDFFSKEAIKHAETCLPEDMKLYWIKPEDFLNLALRLKNKMGDSAKRKGLQQYLDSGGVLEAIPFLRVKHRVRINPETFERTQSLVTAEIWGHEGRHRSLAMIDRNVKLMPVILIFQEMKNHTPKYIYKQESSERFLFRDIFKE